MRKRYIIIGTSTCDDMIYFDGNKYKTLAEARAALDYIGSL